MKLIHKYYKWLTQKSKQRVENYKKWIKLEKLEQKKLLKRLK